ncbi:MAG TPA: DivIVA domain-containing protein [Actinomycetota bacterium]
MGKDKTKGTDASSPKPAEPRARLTPIDVQQKEFRVSRFGGYKMRDVDEFLDQITDTLTALTIESDRQRSPGASDPLTASPDLDDVARQADEIIARARADAARIVAEAKATGAASSMSAAGPADRPAVNAFLAREREFLQSLAGLVQEHAEAVKGMARSARPTPTKTKPDSPAGESTQGAPASAGAAAGPTAAGAVSAPASERSTGESPTPPAGDDATGATAVQDTVPTPAAGSAGSPRDEASREPTRLPESEETVHVQEPASATASRGDGEADGDRSLRDLFWGED